MSDEFNEISNTVNKVENDVKVDVQNVASFFKNDFDKTETFVKNEVEEVNEKFPVWPMVFLVGLFVLAFIAFHASVM